MSTAQEDDPARGSVENALSRLRVGRAIESTPRQHAAVRIDVARETSPFLRATLQQALQDLEHKRGGPLLAATLLGPETPDSFLETAIGGGEVLIAVEDDALVGMALVRGGVLEALYVEPAHRRRGIGRALVHRAVEVHEGTLDAYALPGDRATKSLYESVGWKTRLLTMRGE